MPKLSIIIPTFKSAPTIRKCLQSIADQTFSDYEVIVQDGGSTDSTMELVREFHQANSQMRIEAEQVRDNGVYDAMNKGVARAKGEWLYFLGSDDELHDPTVLAKVLGDGDAIHGDVLYGNVKVIGDSGLGADGTIYDGSFDLKKLLLKNISHQAMFYKAGLIQEIGGYNVDYVVCADWDLNMRCMAKAKFQYVDVTVANFCTEGMSSQHRRDTKFIADMAANVMRYFNLRVDDPMINVPEFVGYGDILSLRESKLKKALKAGARRLKIMR